MPAPNRKLNMYYFLGTSPAVFHNIEEEQKLYKIQRKFLVAGIEASRNVYDSETLPRPLSFYFVD